MLACCLGLACQKFGRFVSLSLPLFWFVCAVVSALRLISKHSKEPLDSPFLLNTFNEAVIYLCFSSLFFVISNVPDKSQLTSTKNHFEVSVESNLTDVETSERTEIKIRSGTKDSKSSLCPSSCPLSSSPFISRLTFMWMFRLLITGIKSKIQLSDLNPICEYVKSKFISRQFEENLKKVNCDEKSVSTLRFLSLIWKSVRKSYLVGSFFELLCIFASYGSPFMIR